MPESDRKRCAELAEWMGWEKGSEPDWYLEWNADHSDYRVRILGGTGVGCGWAPDIDSVAALELLDWLMTQPCVRMGRSDFGSHTSGVYLFCNHGSNQSARAVGPPSVAWTRAIFEVACKVMQAEKEG